MQTIEDLNEVIKGVSQQSSKYAGLHSVYFDSVTKRLGEGYAEVAEDTTTYLESLATVDSYSAAVKAHITFEDSAKAKLLDLHNSNAEAAKIFQDDMVKLLGLSPEQTTVKETKKKAPAKKRSATRASK
jgi:hypothetical protein